MRVQDRAREPCPEAARDAPLVVELGVGGADDAALVGGKALGLERLMAAQLPCPPAFCVTAKALQLYLDAVVPREHLTQLLASASLEQARRDLHAIAFAEELPTALNNALAEATDRLCSRLPDSAPLAVRSSATDEDGKRHSFAGLHETMLGVPPRGVAATVRKCWASLWSPTALAYRAAHGLPLSQASMAVIVQALVPARAAAVVFTANPLSGASDEIVIHATCGLGCTLVDGQITPDTAIFDKSGLTLKRLEVGEKHLRIDPRLAGGVHTTPIQERLPALSEQELRRLARLAIEAECALAEPIDLEAALCGRWYVIQARAITTL